MGAEQTRPAVHAARPAVPANRKGKPDAKGPYWTNNRPSADHPCCARGCLGRRQRLESSWNTAACADASPFARLRLHDPLGQLPHPAYSSFHRRDEATVDLGALLRTAGAKRASRPARCAGSHADRVRCRGNLTAANVDVKRGDILTSRGAAPSPGRFGPVVLPEPWLLEDGLANTKCSSRSAASRRHTGDSARPQRTKAMNDIPEEYYGWWRITETGTWVDDGLDDLEPAMISFTGDDDRLRMHCLAHVMPREPSPVSPARGCERGSTVRCPARTPPSAARTAD